jgi:hypothetical protein
MSTTKLTGRENVTKNTFCVGPVGPSDKENQVKMYKKYRVPFLVHYLFETVGSGSVSNSRIRIRVKSGSRIRIKRVWICNTAIGGKWPKKACGE